MSEMILKYGERSVIFSIEAETTRTQSGSIMIGKWLFSRAISNPSLQARSSASTASTHLGRNRHAEKIIFP
jgi:hypothetical protein